MKKLSNCSSLRFSEYSDGTAELTLFRLDATTRRFVPESVMHLDMGVPQPPTPLEALFMGAAELLGRDLYGFNLTY